MNTGKHIKKGLLLGFLFAMMSSCSNDENEVANDLNPQGPETDKAITNYTPMVVEGRTWIWGSHPAITNELRFREYFLGDTLIGGATYKKLFRYIIRDNNTEYVCALREKEKKIYCVKRGQSNESIIYDFSLEKDDKLSFQDNETLVVDTVIFQDGRRNLSFTLYTSYGTIKASWIEGIGVTISGLSESHRFGADGAPILHYCEENGEKIWIRNFK